MAGVHGDVADPSRQTLHGDALPMAVKPPTVHLPPSTAASVASAERALCWSICRECSSAVSTETSRTPNSSTSELTDSRKASFKQIRSNQSSNTYEISPAGNPKRRPTVRVRDLVLFPACRTRKQQISRGPKDRNIAARGVRVPDVAALPFLVLDLLFGRRCRGPPRKPSTARILSPATLRTRLQFIGTPLFVDSPTSFSNCEK